MIWFFEVVFFISLFLLIHSYFLYPLHLFILHSLLKKKAFKSSDSAASFPYISCITAVYNEEEMIQDKLNTLLTSDYPSDKLEFYIGSDASVDDSNNIIIKTASLDRRIHFFSYNDRRGKTNVINDLMGEAFRNKVKSVDHIILFTDANVMLDKNTIRQLSAYFSSPEVALVDTKIIQKNLKEDGISYSENQYMSLETRLKYWEGEVWGKMMGAFGGCFAIRSVYLDKIPSNLIVDDFYISMKTLIQGGVCKVNLDAVCYEGIPNLLLEEFKRKSRISIGNFQNLAIFFKEILKTSRQLLYSFISHKLIRWIGPFLLILLWISSFILSNYGYRGYMLCFFILNLFYFLIPLGDYILSKLGIHLRLLRGIRYFFLMNLALLNGFIMYMTGRQNSSWQPPKRSLN